MKKTILVVDDEDCLREALSEMLRQYEFNVLEGGSGVEALDIISTTKIDFLLTDIQMPKMNGVELIKKINGLGGEKPRIFIMSGNVSSFDLSTLGAEGILHKPFPIDAFIDALLFKELTDDYLKIA